MGKDNQTSFQEQAVRQNRARAKAKEAMSTAEAIVEEWPTHGRLLHDSLIPWLRQMISDLKRAKISPALLRLHLEVLLTRGTRFMLFWHPRALRAREEIARLSSLTFLIVTVMTVLRASRVAIEVSFRVTMAATIQLITWWHNHWTHVLAIALVLVTLFVLIQLISFLYHNLADIIEALRDAVQLGR